MNFFMNFDGLSFSVHSEILSTLKEIFQIYPKLYSSLTAIGFHEDIEREFNQRRFFLGRQMGKNISYLKIPIFQGLFQRIVSKNKITNEIGFVGILMGDSLKKITQTSFDFSSNNHLAKNTRNIRGQVFHEFGHILDDVLGISQSEEFFLFCSTNEITPEKIEENLSIYGATSPQEFIAEVFAEYHCSKEVNSFTLMVMNYLTEKYKNYENQFISEDCYGLI